MILQIFITVYMDSDEAIRNMDYISEEIIIIITYLMLSDH